MNMIGLVWFDRNIVYYTAINVELIVYMLDHKLKFSWNKDIAVHININLMLHDLFRLRKEIVEATSLS